jgi:DNA helicase II / ATP-dependent DNA helicase PcrA
VLVVLDDEEGNYSLFSYDKLLKLKPLSRTDLEHAAAGDDTVLGRTWRLLYVCASRARRALAIVLYQPTSPQRSRRFVPPDCPAPRASGRSTR